MRHSNCEITELVDGYYGWQQFPGGYALRLAWLVFGDGIDWGRCQRQVPQAIQQNNNVRQGLLDDKTPGNR